MQGVRMGVAHRPDELRRCVAAGWAAGVRVDFLSCMAAACWRGSSRHILWLALRTRSLLEGRVACSCCAVDYASRR